MLVRDTEIRAALGGNIDMTSRGKRSCGDPENFLFEDPWLERGGNVVVEDAHDGWKRDRIEYNGWRTEELGTLVVRYRRFADKYSFKW